MCIRDSGMCGIDAGMIQAKKLEGDYGYVGDITHINTEPIENAIANGYIPVSYTHLDVYKRQASSFRSSSLIKRISTSL